MVTVCSLVEGSGSWLTAVASRRAGGQRPGTGIHRTAGRDTARLSADALGLAGPGARAVRRRGRHRSRSWPLQKSAFSSCRRWTWSVKAGGAVGIVFLSVWVCDRRAILGIALISAQQPDPGTHRIDVRRDDTLGRAADPTW
jgi:hypothetical protein